MVNVVSFLAFILKNEVWLISTHAQEYRLAHCANMRHHVVSYPDHTHRTNKTQSCHMLITCLYRRISIVESPSGWGQRTLHYYGFANNELVHL